MRISNNYNSPNFTSLTSTIGKAVKNSGDVTKKIFSKFEQNSGDNTFYGLAGIMFGAVLLPRVITAAKRNPNNKEATKDEITEILFRDVQTILIMLFGLKMLNSGIGNIATKISGIPMVEEPLNKIFNNNSKGLKALGENTIEFVKHPIKYGKEILKNIGKIAHPTGGSILSTGEQINSCFVGRKSLEEIRKFLNTTVPEKGGDSKKVFKKIIASLIKEQDEIIAKEKRLALAKGETPNLESLLTIKEKLRNMLKEDGFDRFMETDDFNDMENLMVAFFDKKNNSLARSARNVKDWLRMLALGIEVTYLGFGLPALNQKRLEKKYLSEKPIGEQRGDTFSPINDRHIKAQEIKLYSQFMK